MAELAAEGRENLARQKRFLLTMCVIVAAFYALGAYVCEDVTYSGFVLRAVRPENAVYGLWVIWAWALVTYGQRLYKLFEAVRASIEADVEAEDRRMALRVGRRFALQRAETDFGERVTNVTVDRRSIRIGAPFEDIVDERGKVEEAQEVEHYRTMEGGRIFRHMNANVRGLNKKGGGRFSTAMAYEMEWGGAFTRWHVVKAWFRALFGRPAITQHFGPLLAVVVTVGIAVCYSNGPDVPRECHSTQQKYEGTR